MWQLSIFHKTLKYDALDITLPWRYFVSNALGNGILPWWNPYQLHGFAQGTSPETWYPIGILLGWWQGYGLFSLNIEFLLHLFLASWGFYRLSRSLGFSVRSSQFGAMIFPLSGFFIGHAQHMGWIIAGAWIPHVLASLLYFSRDLNWSHGASFVVSLFLLLSGGYPGLSIATLYVILIISAWYLAKKSSRNERTRYFKNFLRLFILSICTCAVLIACFISLKNSLWRGQGLAGEDSLVGSFYIKHLISLMFPFSTVKGSFEVWMADQSVMNIYLGLPALLIVSIGCRSIKKYSKFLAFALLGLLLSLGAELPFRTWLNALPLWDLFRFPALFRYFFILSMILLTVQILDNNQTSIHSLRRSLTKLFGTVALISGLLFVYWIFAYPSTAKMVLQLSLPSVLSAFIFQTLTICTLSGLGALIFSRLGSIRFWPALFLISALDLCIMVQTNGRVSVFSEKEMAPMQNCLKELPKGYPTPSLLDPIGSNEDRTLHFGSIYRNTSMLFKQPSWDGYSPFQYKGYVEFNNGIYYENALQQPIAFLSRLDPIEYGSDHYVSASLLFTGDNRVKLLDFKPNRLQFEVDIEYPRLLVVNQNFTQSWKAQVDGNDLPIVKTDQNLLSIVLPAGAKRIDLSYENTLLANTLWISVILFSSLLLILMFIFFPTFAWIVALIAILAFGFSADHPGPTLYPSKSKENAKEINVILNELDESPSTDANFMKDRFIDWKDFPRFRELVRNQRSAFIYKGRQPCSRQDHFHNFLNQSTHLDTLRRSKNQPDIYYPKGSEYSMAASFNSFEGYAKGWKKMERSNILASNGNRFQRLNGEKFSALWETPLTLENTENLKLRLSIETRSADVDQAGLVFTFGKEEAVVVYKSQVLERNQDPARWIRTSWTSEITLDPGTYDLRVYLWNPAKKNLDLDNFDIEVVRQ